MVAATQATSVEGPAVVRYGTWYLRNNTTSGRANASFGYGNPGDKPVMGDWDGDGVDTPGVVRGAAWYLRNSNTQGRADLSFLYGNPGDEPVVGDWDGDGVDTPGVVRGAAWYLRDSNDQGRADYAFLYGNPGDRPVVGDWDGDDFDSPGVVRGAAWYLRNSNSEGPADYAFLYGNPGDTPLAGDWDGDGVDTPAAVRGATWFARQSNSQGVADITFTYGNPGDIALHWAGEAGNAVLVTCENDETGYRIGYPSTWYTNDGSVLPACSAFDNAPVDVQAGTEIPLSTAVVVLVQNVPFERASDPDPASERDVARSETTVDGRRAVVVETESTGSGLAPAGTLSYRYVVDLGGRTFTATTRNVGPLDYDAKKQLIDRMMDTVAFTGTEGPQPVGEPSTDPVTSSGYPGEGRPDYLTAVRTGDHAGFDRVVFEFEGSVPTYRVAFVDPPIVQQPSGQQIAIEGQAFIEVRMLPASGVDLSGDQPRETYEGPDRVQAGDDDLVREVVKTEDFESHLTWVIGLDRRGPFGVDVLHDPSRLVIDVVVES